MAGIISDVDICNLSQSILSNNRTINSIDTPSTDAEKAYALWYDDVRESFLRKTTPSFAKERRLVAKLSSTPAFGYAFYYEYPDDAVRVLGFGEIDDKDLSYSIEGRKIATDLNYTGGMPLRFVKDVKDITKFDSDSKILFATMLAIKVCKPITQNDSLKAALMKQLPMDIMGVTGVNAQEDPPIRKSNSKFKQSRIYDVSRNNVKK